ncbi:toxin-antitoxin system protein [Lachnospiraceae bacterium MD335]|nr:toxin-antitoxin system protein [Lachnospiraceae bacterium MD335]
MRFIYAAYNILHNCIDITAFNGYILRIDCGRAEEGLRTTPCSECALNALAIDKPLEYATLYLEGSMQTWVDAEDSLELW